MRLLFIFYFFMITISAEGQEKELKLEWKDRALFRIPGKVVYFSEALKLTGALEKITCLEGESFLLKAISPLYKKKGPLPSDYNNLKDKKKLALESLLKIEKMKTYAPKESNINDSPLLKASIRKRCQGVDIAKEKEGRELLSLEVFLRDRFEDGKDGEKKMKAYLYNIFQKTKHEWLIEN